MSGKKKNGNEITKPCICRSESGKAFCMSPYTAILLHQTFLTSHLQLLGCGEIPGLCKLDGNLVRRPHILRCQKNISALCPLN